MSTAVNLEIGFEREEDNIWGEDGFKRRENRVKWSLTVELFPLYNIENHSSAEFINNSHLSAKESELWLSQISFLKTKLFKTKKTFGCRVINTPPNKNSPTVQIFKFQNKLLDILLKRVWGVTAGDEFGEKLKIKETLSTVTDSQRKADSTIQLDSTLDSIAILSALFLIIALGLEKTLYVGWLFVKILVKLFFNISCESPS